jgi:replicative DNA helicase
MINQKQPSAYDVAADDICAVLVGNELEYNRVRFEYGITPHMMPEGAHQKFVQAVYYLRENQQPVTDAAIMARCEGVSLAWILDRIVLYDESRIGQVTRHNSGIVREEGLKRGTQRLLAIAQNQINTGEKSRETIVNQLIDLLGSIGLSGAITDVRADQHGKKNREERLKKSLNIQSTGLSWLDELGASWERKQIWWIAGAHKSRKTTLALNLAIGAALQGQRPAILSKEMPQERVQAMIEAMLATAYLYRKGYVGQCYEYNGKQIGFDWISGKWLIDVGGAYKNSHPMRREAIEFAYETYDKLPLRVYDTANEHGGLTDVGSIKRVISRDTTHEGGDLFMVDYFQLFGSGDGGYFDQMSSLARDLQDFTRTKNVTLITLAQKNESSISGVESYSPGIKGGGDAAQTADYLMTTTYKDGDEAQSDSQLVVQMKLSRYTAGGNGVKTALDIHAKSGLIYAQKWVRELKI